MAVINGRLDICDLLSTEIVEVWHSGMPYYYCVTDWTVFADPLIMASEHSLLMYRTAMWNFFSVFSNVKLEF